MCRLDYDVVLGIPDHNSGAVEIRAAGSVGEISVELNVPTLRTPNKIDVSDISTSHSQGLHADFRVCNQGLKIRSFTSSFDRYIKYAAQLLWQCQRVQVEPSE